ncbi:hypothetical protein DFA_05088 [Cavenderia fasciculata]|uniref:Uncharacterized protein n=1 Tax=Cavenderia fasciculata TaxID=261658 RepID=F4PNA5_CACFS|nr:uncharacterized protein DFA_05088 [Cavenderia fasciculata]EGG22958.1 hypothetical protein DFA_05088 [Cavenderia fasciculata]|eukprot:XP_004360809.1 hypothetical protein DFA_05088 [Cavenderia fasciculata]
MAVALDQQHLCALKASDFFNNSCTLEQRHHIMTTMDIKLYESYIFLGKPDDYLRILVAPLPPQPTAERCYQLVGNTNEIDEVMVKYPPTHYTYGCSYNSKTIHELVYSNWNQGARLYFLHPYMMGDNSSAFEWGYAAWCKGLLDQPDKDKWVHGYYKLENGRMVRYGSNDQSWGRLYIKPIC